MARSNPKECARGRNGPAGALRSPCFVRFINVFRVFRVFRVKHRQMADAPSPWPNASGLRFRKRNLFNGYGGTGLFFFYAAPHPSSPEVHCGQRLARTGIMVAQ